MLTRKVEHVDCLKVINLPSADFIFTGSISDLLKYNTSKIYPTVPNDISDTDGL